MTPPKDRMPAAFLAPGGTGAGPAIPIRRLLRTLGGVDLWHIEEPKKSGQKWPTIRYEVSRNGGSGRFFDQSPEAWRYFQQLTNAPDRDIRPEPPPIEAPLLDGPRKPRKIRRRPGRKPS